METVLRGTASPDTESDPLRTWEGMATGLTGGPLEGLVAGTGEVRSEKMSWLDITPDGWAPMMGKN